MSIYLYTFSTVPKTLLVDGEKHEMHVLNFACANCFKNDGLDNRIAAAAYSRWERSSRMLGDITYFTTGANKGKLVGDEPVYLTEPGVTPDAVWLDADKMPGDAKQVGYLRKRGARWHLASEVSDPDVKLIDGQTRGDVKVIGDFLREQGVTKVVTSFGGLRESSDHACGISVPRSQCTPAKKLYKDNVSRSWLDARHADNKRRELISGLEIGLKTARRELASETRHVEAADKRLKAAMRSQILAEEKVGKVVKRLAQLAMKETSNVG